jgi:hypothetical protein
VDVLSIRYAILALHDALGTGILETRLVSHVERSLQLAASFLTTTKLPDRPGWSFSFGGRSSERAAQTTALLLLPASVFDPALPGGMAAAAVRYVRDEVTMAMGPILGVEFRVPGWDRVAEVQGWELPMDAVLASGLLTLSDVEDVDIDGARPRIARIADAEAHGHWFDLGGLPTGKHNAFPSNSLLNLRALNDWEAAMRTELHGPSIRSRAT